MTTETILFILLNGIISVGLSLFFYKSHLKDKSKWSLIALRFLSFFLIITLLYGFSFEVQQSEVNKPKLFLAIDNSESMLQQADSIELVSLIQSIKSNRTLTNLFEVQTYKFSDKVNLNDSLNFKGSLSNLDKAFQFYKQAQQNNDHFLVITDAQQNFGQSIAYTLSSAQKNKAFGLLVGDTSQVDDLLINRLNVNKYAFINNKFPVEVFVTNSSNQTVTKLLQLKKDNQLLSSKSATLLPNSSQSHQFEILADKLGQHIYNLEIESLDNERNLNNNSNSFGIEVIDNRYKILVLSNLVHPDIGALKSVITRTNQYNYTIKRTSETININNYDLIIAYQPNQEFKIVLDQIMQSKKNLWIIGGTQTDYNLLNTLDLGFKKSTTSLVENVQAQLTPNFSAYQTSFLGLDNYPPLQVQLSPIETFINYQTLLKQGIKGFDDESPLWMLKSNSNQKISILFGEGFWQWRSKSYQIDQTFEGFDKFINQHIQFLASSTRRQRLEVNAKTFYNTSEKSMISAKYYDANYVPVTNAQLNIRIKNTTSGQTNSLILSRDGDTYRTSINSLPPGTYTYQVSVDQFEVKGEFTIIDYNIELEHYNANYALLNSALAKNHLFLSDQVDSLVQRLADEKPKVIQKYFIKQLGLIEIKYILGLLILTLGIEWFIRKFKGLT